jgi:Methyltransferase domain.
MDWETKSKVLRILSAMPFSEHALYLLQRYVTKTIPRTASSAIELVSFARRVQSEVPGFDEARLLEIGAGKDLGLAIALRLLGSGPVTCVDIERMAKLPLIRSTAAHIANALGKQQPRLNSWTDVDAFGVRYLAPYRLESAPIAPGSIDCFLSLATLEHIPRDDLSRLLQYARTLIRSGGISVHEIDYTDHFAYSYNISPFNFLKFSDAEWSKHNSSFQYVNRLRHSEYVELFQAAGYVILKNEQKAAVPDETMNRLAEQFRRFQKDDLFSPGGTVLALRPDDDSISITRGLGRLDSQSAPM